MHLFKWSDSHLSSLHRSCLDIIGMLFKHCNICSICLLHTLNISLNSLFFPQDIFNSPPELIDRVYRYRQSCHICDPYAFVIEK